MVHIFIVNPYAGKKTFADDLRNKLKNIRNLNYFVFNTRYAGYEMELIRKIQRIFDGEKLRFYCCGGSGTMRNILNGFDNLRDVEVAFFPCGLSNDFLKVFGDSEKRFYQIEELINGDVIEVDYIKTNYGIALNTVSTGLDSHSQTKMEDYRILTIFGRELPYTFSLLSALLFSKNNRYKITIDDKEEVTDEFTELFFGNGYVLGGSLNFDNDACVNDGKGVFSLVYGCKNFKRFSLILAVADKNFKKADKQMRRGYCEKIRIQREDGSPFVINHDGELTQDVNVLEAQIIKKGLRLVVPKGVTI